MSIISRQPKGWIEITDPDGEHQKLFQESRKLYKHFFEGKYEESWGNFGEYIRETQKLKYNVEQKCSDHYLVFAIEDRVLGMTFFTYYRKRRILFVPYLLIDREQKLLDPSLRRITEGLKAKIPEIVGPVPEFVLFEVEKIQVRNLDPAPADDSFGSKRLRMLQSRVAKFQKEGARKIAGVRYLQPDLHLKDMVPVDDLYLLLYKWRTGKGMASDVIDRKTAVELTKFIYDEYYLDGFEVTHPDRLDEARQHLAACRDEMLRSIGSAALIPLWEVNYRPTHVRAHLVYETQSETLRQAADSMKGYLEDMAVRVTTCEEAQVGGYVDERKQKALFDEAQIVISLISPHLEFEKELATEVTLARVIDLQWEACNMGKDTFCLLPMQSGCEEKAQQFYEMWNQRIRNVRLIPFYNDQLIFPIEEIMGAVITKSSILSQNKLRKMSNILKKLSVHVRLNLGVVSIDINN